MEWLAGWDVDWRAGWGGGLVGSVMAGSGRGGWGSWPGGGGQGGAGGQGGDGGGTHLHTARKGVCMAEQRTHSKTA